jgi:hypothetical protein
VVTYKVESIEGCGQVLSVYPNSVGAWIRRDEC